MILKEQPRLRHNKVLNVFIVSQIPKRISHPLGIGFDQIELFLKEYIRKDRDEKTSTPDLGLSLSHIEKIEGIEEMLSGIRQSPLCLIEGCTSPNNGKALKEFIEKIGINNPEIHAIDLIDVKTFLRNYGIEMPMTTFSVGDATNLRKSYSDSSVDVVAQDFLLNCAPYTTHLPIMQEVKRILTPQGKGLICFTDQQCILGQEQITYQQVQKELGLRFNEDAFCIRDLLPDDKRYDLDLKEKVLNELKGKVLVNGREDRYTLVTTDGGNFEFFQPFDSYQKILLQSGLEIEGMEKSSGIDRNGITCVRYRTVLRKIK